MTDTPNRPSESTLDYAQLHRDLTRAVDRVCPRWMADRADDLVQVALMRVMEIQRKREGAAELSGFYLSQIGRAIRDCLGRLVAPRRHAVTLNRAAAATGGIP